MCINQYKDTKYQELQTIQKEARNLESQINAIKFQNQKQSIVSPRDGYVAKLMINTIGGVVTPAEKLISIVPKDSPLIVKVNVLNQDIGFVKKEMLSKIKIDTFSFQKYGFFEGKIINVRIYKSEQFHFCRFGTIGYVLQDSRRQKLFHR
jgi:hemolysin D